MQPNQDNPRTGKQPTELQEATRLESDEEIRQALQARRARLTAQAPPGAQGKQSVAIPVEVEPQAERPLVRPPMAMLCVLDDDKPAGEWVRLRADVAVIGRLEGEVRIPHDPGVSARHAQIVRERLPNRYRWLLVDLHSTNGTFVRIGTTLLRHENEVLIGGGRYRFEAGAGAPPAVAPADAAQQTTQAWTGANPIRALVPSLVEITPAGPVNRLSLTLPEYWIGRDRSCAIVRPDDVFLNARHARLYRDARGQWHLENNKSLNGLWLRITEPIPLSHTCQFRAGEQRFIFRTS